MVKNVILYRTEFCVWCHKAKEFFDENKVKYKEIYVDRDHEKAKEMIKKSGQTGVPVIDIDGKIIIGFNKEALKKELNIK